MKFTPDIEVNFFTRLSFYVKILNNNVMILAVILINNKYLSAIEDYSLMADIIMYGTTYLFGRIRLRHNLKEDYED